MAHRSFVLKELAKKLGYHEVTHGRSITVLGGDDEYNEDDDYG